MLLVLMFLRKQEILTIMDVLKQTENPEKTCNIVVVVVT